MPLPKKVLKKGVKDMVRISDARYSPSLPLSAARACVGISPLVCGTACVPSPLRDDGCEFAAGLPAAGPTLDHADVRILCAPRRMSGTAYGTVVLHVSPEAQVGGPLALVKTGDTVTLDTKGRALTLNITEAEMAARKAAWVPPPPVATRGYAHLYINHVNGAEKGADFDFLVGSSGATVGRHSH